METISKAEAANRTTFWRNNMGIVGVPYCDITGSAIYPKALF